MARKTNKTSHVLNLITNGAPAEPETKAAEDAEAGNRWRPERAGGERRGIRRSAGWSAVTGRRRGCSRIRPGSVGFCPDSVPGSRRGRSGSAAGGNRQKSDSSR